MEQRWRIDIWDGHSSRSFFRTGTYNMLANAYVLNAPPGYIVTIS